MKKETKELLKDVLNKHLPGVYKITRISDGKGYIGQTSLSIEERLRQHIENEYVDENAKGIDSAIKREGADKFTYKTLVPLPEATTEQLWFLEATLIESYDTYNNGFNRTSGNHKGAYDALDLRNKHKVNQWLTKKIEKEYNIEFRDKRVLLIGNFNRQFVNCIEYSGCRVIAVDAYEDKDLMKKLDEVVGAMENRDFDIVISNPPYDTREQKGLGVKISKNILNNIKFQKFINIMPIQDYVSYNRDLYSYIVPGSIINLGQDAFEDVDRTNVSMCELQSQRTYYRTKEHFRIETYNPDMKRYHYMNLDSSDTIFDVPYSSKPGDEFKLDKDKSVILFFRTGGGQIIWSQSNCTMSKWNIFKSITADEVAHTTKKGYNPDKNVMLEYTVLTFKTSTERDNFVNFIYSLEGKQFIHYVRYAMKHEYAFPGVYLPELVDWTKPQTVVSILLKYGYTTEEVREINSKIKELKFIPNEWECESYEEYKALKKLHDEEYMEFNNNKFREWGLMA